MANVKCDIKKATKQYKNGKINIDELDAKLNTAYNNQYCIEMKSKSWGMKWGNNNNLARISK